MGIFPRTGRNAARPAPSGLEIDLAPAFGRHWPAGAHSLLPTCRLLPSQTSPLRPLICVLTRFRLFKVKTPSDSLKTRQIASQRPRIRFQGCRQSAFSVLGRFRLAAAGGEPGVGCNLSRAIAQFVSAGAHGYTRYTGGGVYVREKQLIHTPHV